MRLVFYICFLAVFIFLSGCLTLKKITHIVSKPVASIGPIFRPPYSGPKASIVLTGFDIKAARITKDISLGLHEMLASALVNNDRFVIGQRQGQGVEGAVGLDDVSAPSVGALQKAKVRPADLVVSVAVVEFKPESSGGKAGVGGGGGAGSGVLGGLLGESLNKASLVLDIRVIDASTSAVLGASRIQGQASDVSGVSMRRLLAGIDLAKGLSMYADTPMEKAIRICTAEANRYILKSVPEVYYKY